MYLKNSLGFPYKCNMHLIRQYDYDIIGHSIQFILMQLGCNRKHKNTCQGRWFLHVWWLANSWQTPPHSNEWLSTSSQRVNSTRASPFGNHCQDHPCIGCFWKHLSSQAVLFMNQALSYNGIFRHTILSLTLLLSRSTFRFSLCERDGRNGLEW